MKLFYLMFCLVPALMSGCAREPLPTTRIVAQELRASRVGTDEDLMTQPLDDLMEGEELEIYLSLRDAAPDIENCTQTQTGARCGHFINDMHDWRPNDGWFCKDCSISILDSSGQSVCSFKFRDEANLSPYHKREFLDSYDSTLPFKCKVPKAGPYTVHVRYVTQVVCAGGLFDRCTTKVGEVKLNWKKGG